MAKKRRRAERMADVTDIKEREAALDPTKSFIVQAPAGSGKTTLLIQRFLKLLATVKRPEEILAVTFTRKAAGEMHGRIVEALEEARAGMPVKDYNEAAKLTLDLAEKALIADKKHGWNLLENPGRLCVQTIDSFCATLARQAPLLSRLGMEPSVSESPERLYEEAVGRALALVDDEGPDGEAIRQLLRYNDNSLSALGNKLVVMLKKRDQWLRHIPDVGVSRGLRETLEKAMTRLVESGLGRATDAFPDELRDLLTFSARYAAEKVAGGHAIAALRDLTDLPPATAENLGLWKAITGMLLVNLKDNKGAWRSPRGVNSTMGFPPDKTDEAIEAKDSFKGLLSALDDNDALLQALREVWSLPGPRYDEADWLALRALLHILPLAIRRLEDVFSQEGVLDFPAVSLAALKALGPEEIPTDLMLLLDNTFRHILVDEYQDTSWTQISLIKALTNGWEVGDGRTLFIVGDPMQSIYLFRDADVGLFLRAKQDGIGGVELIPLQLKSNFRSEGHLVNWVNETFSGVFPEAENPDTGAVVFGEGLAVKGADKKARVNITLLRGRDDVKEAESVVDIINKIGEGERTIAILVRSRSHLETIVAALKKADIDFLAEELTPLGDRPVINDLFALFSALRQTSDRVAWLSVLRARWCGLTLGDMHALCLGGFETPIWELIHDSGRLAKLSEDGGRRLLQFREVMAKAMNLRGRVSWRGLLEGVWTALGGEAVYEDDDFMGEAERFFVIVESLDEAGVIRYPEELARRVRDLRATESGKTDNPLRIMTIHKAKGLEFDHVILPGLGRGSGHSDKEIFYWIERDNDLLLAPMEEKGGAGECLIYQYLAGVQSEREALERTRLFYVAVTRAAKELYLLGHIDASVEEVRPRGGTFLALIAPFLREEMVMGYADAGPGTETGPPNLHLKRLSCGWTAPRPALPCLVSEAGAERVDVSGETRPVFDWAGAGARHSGTVAHRYLYRIASDGLSEWDAQRATGEKARMEAMLRGLGLNGEEARAGAERSLNIIIKALSDERGRWILGLHVDGAAEYALTGIIEGSVRRVIIDRTFIDEKGLRWVIDYKTGEHRGGDLAGFLEAEKERYRSQLEGYAEVLGAGGGEKNIRKGLYYPAIPAWIEW